MKQPVLIVTLILGVLGFYYSQRHAEPELVSAPGARSVPVTSLVYLALPEASENVVNSTVSVPAAGSAAPAKAAAAKVAQTSAPAHAAQAAEAKLAQATAPPADSGTGKFVAPDVSFAYFAADKLSLPAAERVALATGLSDQVRVLAEPNGKDAVTAARLLSIALRLDPSNRGAVLTSGRLKRGLPLPATPETPAAKAFAQQLMGIHKKLLPANTDDAKLAGCLLDLASTLDPGSDDILFALETQKPGDKPDWAKLTLPASGSATAATAPAVTPASTSTAPTAASTAPPPPLPTGMSEMVKIKGLVVSELLEGELSGKVMEIIANRTVAADLTVKVNGPVADDMSTSLEEAKRLVLSRPLAGQAKGAVTVSFDNKYSKKAGGSAGTAFAVALTALLEGITIDQAFAMTGDITVDGKVRKIGGVAAKIEGAVIDKCKVVAVPEENSEDVTDMVLLTSPNSLTQIQIFSIPTFDSALALARTDRPKELAEAMAEFNKAAIEIGPAVTPLMVNRSRAKLENVLKLAPNHLSAKYLLQLADNRFPTRLSLLTAVERIFSAARPILIIRSNERQVYHFSSQTYRRVISNLKRLERMLPREAEGVYFTTLALVGAVEDFDTFYENVPSIADSNTLTAYVQRYHSDAGRLSRLENLVKQFMNLSKATEKLITDTDLVKKLWR
ncbi:hypothetical protein DB346_06415 [Verrucomicrobia bacterium LW23]|nr:hypothetical protein DB346_06415 [Verrucomicrobia bacterium LW23]